MSIKSNGNISQITQIANNGYFQFLFLNSSNVLLKNTNLKCPTDHHTKLTQGNNTWLCTALVISVMKLRN
jgi:hypothetical protein